MAGTAIEVRMVHLKDRIVPITIETREYKSIDFEDGNFCLELHLIT